MLLLLLLYVAADLYITTVKVLNVESSALIYIRTTENGTFALRYLLKNCSIIFNLYVYSFLAPFVSAFLLWFFHCILYLQCINFALHFNIYFQINKSIMINVCFAIQLSCSIKVRTLTFWRYCVWKSFLKYFLAKWTYNRLKGQCCNKKKTCNLIHCKLCCDF